MIAYQYVVRGVYIALYPGACRSDAPGKSYRPGDKQQYVKFKDGRSSSMPGRELYLGTVLASSPTNLAGDYPSIYICLCMSLYHTAKTHVPVLLIFPVYGDTRCNQKSKPQPRMWGLSEASLVNIADIRRSWPVCPYKR